MSTESSTYIDEGEARETVTLLRGPLTPTGHAILKIAYIDGGISDCYVDLAWLRDRADQLADTPRPEGAEEIEAAIRKVVPSHPEDRYGDLADRLAERGVRVTGGN